MYSDFDKVVSDTIEELRTYPKRQNAFSGKTPDTTILIRG